MVNLFLDVYLLIVLGFDRLIVSHSAGVSDIQDGGALKLKLLNVGMISALPILLVLLTTLHLGWI